MNVKRGTVESELEKLLNSDPVSVVEHARSRYNEIAGDFADSILLFGCGPLGRRTLAGLRSLAVEPMAFVDNNPDLWNRSLDGLRVLPPQEAAQKFGDKAVFVVTIYNGSAARQQLKSMHCLRVVPFAYLYWKYSEALMPHLALDLPNSIYAQTEHVREALSLWADDASRQEYVAQLRWRLLLDFEGLPRPSPVEETYFPKDLISLSDDEIFVDCGAFDGDTVRSILRLRGDKFKAIIPIEPDRENFGKLKAFVSNLTGDIRGKIFPCHLATASYDGELSFEGAGTVTSAANALSGVKVECAPLDNIVAGYTPTYVKMDIEGAEYDSLQGARQMLKRTSAVWAICLYHRQDDLWRIPLLINSLSDGYRLFLRRYAEECWELVCYAVPMERLTAAGIRI